MSFVADSVRIGILGDFQPKAPNLPAIEKSLQHASSKLQIGVEAKWIPTPSVLEPNGQKTLESFDGIWAAPGSPYKSFDGMLKGIEFNGPKLSGAIPEIRLRPGSYLHSFYTQDVVTEQFFCNFEVNPEYEWAAMEAGFPVVARGPNGEIRAIESPTHRFYIATLFQPQLSSKPNDPHPLVMAFVQAAADWGKKKLDDSVLE